MPAVAPAKADAPGRAIKEAPPEAPRAPEKAAAKRGAGRAWKRVDALIEERRAIGQDGQTAWPWRTVKPAKRRGSKCVIRNITTNLRKSSQQRYYYLVKLSGTWKSVKGDKPPTGRKVSNTFRDISLSQCTPEYIDDFDYVCQQKGIKRSELEEAIDRTKNRNVLEHLNETVRYDPDRSYRDMAKRFGGNKFPNPNPRSIDLDS